MGRCPTPRQEPFWKKVLGTPKTLKKFISRICCGSVLSKQTATFFRGPYPKSLAQSRFRLGAGRRGHHPFRFGILAAQKNSSEAYARTTLVPHVQNAHNPGDLQGGSEPPCTPFLRFTSLGRAKEVNKNLLQLERFVRSSKTFFKILQLFFKNPLTNPQLSCIIYPVIQRQQVSVKACRSPAEEDVNLTHRVYYVLSSRRALALTEKVFFFL